MKRFILIHYSEIGLKKANKGYFVGKLRNRIKIMLEQRFRRTFSIKHTLGRLLADLPDGFVEEEYVDVLNKIFAIKSYKFVYEGAAEIEEIAQQIWNNLSREILDPKTRPQTFRVNVKRSMVMSMKSVEAERDIGAVLLDNGIDINVKMKDPEFVVDIEFLNGHGYFSYKKYQGVGGLSSNSQGKLIALLSAGIDSPVAAYRMIRRGARIIFTHFHGYPYTDKDEMEQVKDLVKILSEYQAGTKLYLLPFGQIQRAIAINLDIPGKVRTVLYRRVMLMIAERIAKKERAKGLVTGDSFGQVASQTPENIFVIHEASTIPLFQPLIGYDKDEIIKLSEGIGTFEISKLPCKESCTMFMPKNPEIRANVHDIREYEKNLPIQEWIEKVLKESEIVNF